MPYKASDLSVGVALFLDPEALASQGGRFTGEEEARIREHHYFVCLECGEREGKWLPLFSTHRFDREELKASKSGHPGFTDKTSYYDPNQLWTVSHQVVLKAAQRARDISDPWNPNLVDPAGLPDLWWLAEATE